MALGKGVSAIFGAKDKLMSDGQRLDSTQFINFHDSR